MTPLILPRGSFILVHTNGRAARGIQLATLSHVNHAAIVDASGVNVIEANPAGVQRRPLAEYDPTAIAAVGGLSLSDWQRVKVLRAAEAKIGDTYNWPGIAALGMDRFFGWRPSWLDNAANQPTTWFCSQLVVAAYRAAGVDLCPGRPDWTCSPGELADAILRSTLPA